MARYNLRPRPKPSKAPSPFLALPTELRLQIYNYLIPSESTSYYGPADPPADPPGPRLRQHRRRYALRRHGMLLANRQLHAEYMQAFYERTSFSFYIDTDNGMWIATDNGIWIATAPFLTLPPPALLRNLRQCKLCVDLGMLPCGLVFSTKAYVARIEALLGRMKRVRWVHLVWDYAITMGPALWELEEDEWLRELWRKEEELWEWLGERFVQRLKGGAGMRGMIVTVGERTLKLEKEGAEWVEREVVPY
jgi:hypothetical protein